MEKEKQNPSNPDTGSQHGVNDLGDSKLKERTSDLEEKVGRLEQQTNTKLLEISADLDIVKKAADDTEAKKPAVPDSVVIQMTEIQTKVKMLEDSVAEVSAK